MHIYAELLGGGPELFIVLGIIALLFGGSQIPKFARSLGQAKREFEHGTRESASAETVTASSVPAPD